VIRDRWCFNLVAAAAVLSCADAAAATDDSSAAASEETLAAVEERVERTARAIDELLARLAAERDRLEADRRALAEYRREASAALAAATGRGPADAAAAPAPEPPQPVGVAPAESSRPLAPAQLFDEPTALTPRGQLVVEGSQQFVHSTDNRVALVGYTILPAVTIGLIDVRRVSRGIDTFSLTARYGLFRRLEFEVKAPYVWASSSTLTRPLATASTTDSFFDATGSGLGDVEVAARTQLNRFRGDNAVWIAYLRYKSHTGTGVFEVPVDPDTGLQTELPTGSGFAGIQPGVTFLVPSDPAIFFGGVAYNHNFSRQFDGYGTVRPGGVIDVTLGMGLALNERSSFSVGYQHSVVGQTSQRNPEEEGRVLAPTGRLQLGTMRFGLSYRLTDRFNMNLTVGIGATRDTPDMEATLRLPYRF
jgi:hypothetical protein